MWPVFGDQDGLFDTSGYIPYLVITFAVTMFSWLMLGKYKSLRNIPDTTTKKTGKLYGIIGISLILAFLLLYTFFVKVNQP
ncbi:MAG: hypothetical protein JWM52_307 [Candidatus Saccharibacteria bacterium]|nr:hypothetical protein [Candidatus Saccharibacteria bacterium]